MQAVFMYAVFCETENGPKQRRSDIAGGVHGNVHQGIVHKKRGRCRGTARRFVYVKILLNYF